MKGEIQMDVLEAIKTRRAINYFEKGRELPEDLLKELLNLANLCPSSFNLQPWEVIVVRDPGMKKELRACAMDQPKVEEASVVLVMVADPGAVERHQELVFQDRLKKGYMKDASQFEGLKAVMKQLYGEPGSLRRMIFATKNTAFYAMTIMLAAKGLGLETHPMDGFDEEAVKRLFKLPQEKIIPLLIAIGYPKPGLKLLERPFRRELREFVTYY